MASKLINENHSKYHIFSTTEEDRGVFFHNHLAHHAFTLYALGAEPDKILLHYQRNTEYQRLPMKKPTPDAPPMLLDEEQYKAALGDESMFFHFNQFFEYQVKEHGYQWVLQKYLVDGSEIADDMLARMYMGRIQPPESRFSY